MCGLFGAIGKRIDVGSVRALAIMNRERGKDSLGMFDSNGKIVKQAGDPTELLATPDVTGFINNTDRWFLAGHTRAATRGEVKRKNAHPFRYGNIIGSHNGMCHAPKEFAVDSMYLIHRLNKCKGGYQKALEQVSGYWTLTWFDGESLFVQTHDNTLFFAKREDTFYYSSTRPHLKAAMGDVECWPVENNQTYKFSADGSVVQLPDVAVEAKGYWWNVEYDDSRRDKSAANRARVKPGHSWSGAQDGVLIPRTASGTRHSGWRDHYGGDTDATREDYEALDDRMIYENGALELGFMSVADLMNGMSFDNRYDAYEYIDRYYGDRRQLSY